MEEMSGDRGGLLRRPRVDAARLALLERAPASTTREILTATLDLAEELTGSAIGFFHFVDDDQRTLRLQAWSTNTITRMCTAEGGGTHYPLDRAGVWADCVRLRRPVIHEDYPSLPGRKGMPPGHATVVRELTVPILRAGAVCAVLGVGNKGAPYDDGDVESVTVLADLAWDVAARRRAEEALAVERARLDLAARAGGLGLWDLDLVTKAAWRNAEHDRLFGYDGLLPAWGPEDALRHVLPEDRPIFERAFEVAMATGHFHYELRIRPRESPVRWLRADGQVIRDAAGRPVRMLGTVQDVTPQKEAEVLHARVQAEKDRLAALLDSIEDQVWFADEGGRFALANPAALRPFGLRTVEGVPVREMEGSLEVFREDGTPRPVEAAPPLRALRGEVVTGEVEAVRIPTSGELRWREVNATPVRERGGRIVGAVAVVRDVTERRRAENDLRASEQRYRDLVELSPGAVFVNRGDRVEFVNQAAVQLFGAERPDQLLGRRPVDLFHPDFQEVVRGRIAELLRGGRVSTIPERIVRLDGTTRDVEVGAATFHDDRGTAIQVMLHDVTEARALQAQLALSSRLTALGTLVAGIAHEVNNPLAAALSDLELARKQLRQWRKEPRPDRDRGPPGGDALLDGLEEELAEAEAAARRIEELVRQLKTFARSGSPRSRVRLGEVVETAIQWLPTAVREGIDLRVEGAPGPEVAVVPGEIARVVLNLLLNAAAAVIPGSRAEIVVRQGPGPQGGARLEVEDRGTGIAPEILPRIFEPFFTTREVGAGMGLGLAVAHSIVTAHRGRIGVESVPGRGSTFRVDLPAAADPA
jgi:PAS domain S-box-containing protein